MYLEIIKTSEITYSEYEEIYSLLNVEELQRIDRKKKAEDKQCSLAAFFLLDKMLKKYYGINRPGICRTQNGRPYFKDSNIYLL